MRGVVPPMTPENKMFPTPAARVRLCAPFNVLLNVMFALFEVIVLGPVKLTGEGKVKGFAPVTVMLLPI